MKKTVSLLCLCLSIGLIPNFFPVYANEDNELNLSNKNISTISELQEYNFSNYQTINLSNNNLDTDDWPDIINLANQYQNTKFVLFFNNISNAINIPSNVLLGVQNLNSLYLNSFSNNSYDYFETPNFNLSTKFISRLDNLSSFSDENSVQQCGNYNLILSNGSKIYSKSFIYGDVCLSKNTDECEFETNFYEKYLQFSSGLNKEDFYIEITNQDGKIYEFNSIGTYDIVYNIYSCIDGNKAGPILAQLFQTITFKDSTGPTITPNEEYSYVYLFEQYKDSGATALDNISGDCEVFCFNDVDTTKIGKYTQTYIAIDIYGNSSTKIKTVEVIYHPIKSISLNYESFNTYAYNQVINIEIIINDGQPTYFTNPNRIFYIYGNNKLLTMTTSQKFSLTCDQYGINTLKVLTQDLNKEGNIQTLQDTEEFVVLDTNWWKNIILIGIIAGFSILIYGSTFVIKLIDKRKK